jgi:hypothetical protein
VKKKRARGALYFVIKHQTPYDVWDLMQKGEVMRLYLLPVVFLCMPIVGNPEEKTVTLTIKNQTKDTVTIFVDKYGKDLEETRARILQKATPILKVLEELKVQNEKETYNFVLLKPGQSQKIPTYDGRIGIFRYLPPQAGCHQDRLRLPFFIPYEGKDLFPQYCRIDSSDLKGTMYHITEQAPDTGTSHKNMPGVPQEITVINDTKHEVSLAFPKPQAAREQIETKENDNPQVKLYAQQLEQIQLQEQMHREITLQPGKQTEVIMLPTGSISYKHPSCKKFSLKALENEIKDMEKNKWNPQTIAYARKNYAAVQQDTSTEYNACNFYGTDFATTNNTLTITD